MTGHGGKTMCDCRIPAVRIVKLRSQQQIIIDQITCLLDRFTIIQGEINELEGHHE